MIELRDLWTSEAGEMYQGEWIEGEDIKEGRGVQIFQNGSRYDGFWINNLANGRGRLVYDNGDYYIGNWKIGENDGFGIY